MQIDERDKKRTIARPLRLFYSQELLVERMHEELPRGTSSASVRKPETAVAVIPRNIYGNIAAFFSVYEASQKKRRQLANGVVYNKQTPSVL